MELKRLIRNAFFFGLGFLVLSAALQWAYLTYVVKGGAEAEVNEQLEKRAGEIKRLFLGDSHVMKAIDTTLIPGSFVYAFTNENYALNHFRFQRLLEKEVQPQLVLIPFDLHSFSQYRRDHIAAWADLRRTKDYLELGKQKGQYFQHLVQFLRASTFDYVGNYRRILYAVYPAVPRYMEMEGGKWLPMDSTGIAMFDTDLEKDSELAAKAHFGEGHSYPDPVMENDLDKILALCHQGGIDVVLVKYPVTQAYYEKSLEWLGKVDASPINEYYFRGKALPIFDASLEFADRKDLFLDSHHLNENGKAEFSKRLAVWLENLPQSTSFPP